MSGTKMNCKCRFKIIHAQPRPRPGDDVDPRWVDLKSNRVKCPINIRF